MHGRQLLHLFTRDQRQRVDGLFPKLRYISTEADTLNAAAAYEEQVNLRKKLRETEREGESDGGWQAVPSAAVAVDRASPMLLPFSRHVYHSSDFILSGGRERERELCSARQVCFSLP